jgi:dipeptidase E
MGPNIVAIGGGEVRTGETELLDRTLLELTGKETPQVLFVPTASEDAPGYVSAVEIAYGRLGARVESLLLWERDADPVVAARKIASADVVYVGGGNTKAMLARWRELGVDEALRRHLDAGKPVGGVSAGAICWFRVANSDWPQFEGIPGVNTAPLTGMGVVDLAICPHTRDEGFRLAEFTAMMADIPGVGIGVDDGCAIQVRGDEYRILASLPGSQAHLLVSRDGEVTHTPMPPHDDFRPIEALRRGVL